jgi:micrococcal nuclease
MRLRFGIVVAFVLAIFLFPAGVLLAETIYVPMVRSGVAPTATATTPPAPAPTSTLPPPSFNNCQADPNPSAAPNYPIRITAIDKVAETVILQNVTATDTIDLTGWRMCSITGNQQHPISETLAPGQSRTFPGPAGNIWNNSSPDNGALYDAQGRLVSYWNDAPAQQTQAVIVAVIDGDTVDVNLAGAVVRLRLIGIDTPETVDPRAPIECFGLEASAKKLLTGQTVTLEADATQGDQDRYGRLLRYVWLPDGRHFNLDMISQGYAFEYTYAQPYRYQIAFQQAEAEARVQQRGLWSPDTCNGERQPAPPTPTVQPAPTPPTPNCDPAYPDVCIPPPPPDLDCGEIPYRDFRVMPPDPHGFDRDRDGIGCES